MNEFLNIQCEGLPQFSERRCRSHFPFIVRVKDQISRFARMPDEDVRKKFLSFKDRKSFDDVSLADLFALIFEATRRVTGIVLHDVQILGGAEMCLGSMAEIKTGEGKTFVALFPACVWGLSGDGVHIITVNDYLAERDFRLLSPVYEFLGLSAGLVISGTDQPDRRSAYGCDVTYITDREAGFDYLRDNMVRSFDERVQRGLHNCVIDEADSVLIDEARTPVIISGLSGNKADMFEKCFAFVNGLSCREYVRKDGSKMNRILEKGFANDVDYLFDKKENVILLTDAGISKAESYFGIDSYSEPEHYDLRHCVKACMKARSLMEKDKDYVVENGEIISIDEFTGRLMYGRRYSDGVHQALEAKEGLTVRPDTKTTASITHQSFFNLYDRKTGMTGTAYTSFDELKKIYGMNVVVIPTDRPVVRIDDPDRIYLTKAAKYAAVAEYVDKIHATGQPILIGTVCVEDSERLSDMLRQKNIEHSVLHAKKHMKEAEIVAHAGEIGSVIIATNMAGRGTDIKLTDESRALGGLCVIGTERHEARRIDDQLRGRAGRQGDPGYSVFFVSMEDDIMRLYGSRKTAAVLAAMGASKDVCLTSFGLDKFVSNAQKQVEGYNFSIRDAVSEFGKTDNEIRLIEYERRDTVMRADLAGLRKIIESAAYEVADEIADRYAGRNDEFGMEWSLYFPTIVDLSCPEESLRKTIHECVRECVGAKFDSFGSYDSQVDAARYIILGSLDRIWSRYLDDAKLIYNSSGIAGYAGKDSLDAYREKAYAAFIARSEDVRNMMVRAFFKVIYDQESKKV